MKGIDTMSIKVFFDCDGTVFNLYGRKNWLEMIENEVAGAFTMCGLQNNGFLPEINLEEFYLIINKLKEKGATFSVITWLPMAVSKEYEEICKKEKFEWITKNMPFVSEINITPYGVPKQKFIKKKAKQMYLLDDNENVCEMWRTKQQRIAIKVNNNFTVINALKQILEKI